MRLEVDVQGRELGKQILQLVDMDQGGATRD